MVYNEHAKNIVKETKQMNKVICKVTYDTEKDNLVKKVTVGYYGDPAGYEEILFVTANGNYYLNANGGENSIHVGESIKRMSKKSAEAWLEENR